MATADVFKSIFEAKNVPQLVPDRQLSRVRFSPDGKFVLAAGLDGKLHRWNLSGETHTPMSPVEGHHGWVQGLAVLPQGECAVSADSWGQLRCTKFTTEPEVRWAVEAAHDGSIVDLALSPDGKRLATCGYDARVCLWDTATGDRVHEIKGHDIDVMSVTFSADGTSVFSGDLKGRVKQWSVADGKILAEFDATELHTSHRLQEVGGVRVLTVSKSGDHLLVGGTKPKNGGNVQGEPTVLVFDVKSQKKLKTLTLGVAGDVYVTELAELDDGAWLATNSGNPGSGKVVVFRLDQDTPIYETKKYANCHSMAWLPAQKRIAISTTNTGSNGNGRSLKNGEYKGNYSPIFLFQLPEAQP